MSKRNRPESLWWTLLVLIAIALGIETVAHWTGVSARLLAIFAPLAP